MPSVTFHSSLTQATPITFVTTKTYPDIAKEMGQSARQWCDVNGFAGKPGQHIIIPDAQNRVGHVLFGMTEDNAPFASLYPGYLLDKLPAGKYKFADDINNPELVSLALSLKAYQFARYKKPDEKKIDICLPQNVEDEDLRIQSEAIHMARDLINTPANDLGPEELEIAAQCLAEAHKADISVIYGDELLDQNYPLIHAVGRASAKAPRLIRMDWGKKTDPHIFLVGKGVCFDTGGLDLKPSSAMLLMKKDMGGAANILGLASMIMAAKLKIRLSVLIPAVENAVSGGSFRPGDVLPSRKGLSVEIGNTDAEGRLVLADALYLADEEEPEMIIDMATLTGAARVAIGTDIAPFYATDQDFADTLNESAERVADPIWQFPLYQPYDALLSSKIADVNHISSGPYAGSITAALFLKRFIEKCENWSHFDVFGWSPKPTAIGPEGGEVHAIRALFNYFKSRFPA